MYISHQGGVGAGLGDMFGQLDLGSEEGEDQLMKMMQGMMSTLLSKEVLYPSLKELCKQVRHTEHVVWMEFVTTLIILVATSKKYWY